MPDNIEERELHTEQVQEILSYVPHVLVRWGSALIAITIVLMLVGSYFIKYPEVIPASVLVQSTTPATKIVARTGGRIDIKISNNTRVKEGALLAVIENPARTNDILRAVHIADSIRRLPDDSLQNPILPQLILGSAQQAYLNFADKYRQAVYRLRDEFSNERIENVRSQLASISQVMVKVSQQKEVISKELKLVETEYERSKKLFQQGVISQAEFEKQSSNFLSKQRQVDDLDLSYINNKIKREEYVKLLIDLEEKVKEQTLAIKSDLYQSVSYLKVSINEWYYQYALVAPNDGLLSYYRFYGERELVNPGDPVFAIISEDKGIQVWAEVPLVGAGKIEVGQRVNIKLQSYPYKEYGMLVGEVEAITALPNNNAYRLLIHLPNGRKTTYNVELAFKEEMTGLGEVLTKELSLFDRIFNELRSIAQN